MMNEQNKPADPRWLPIKGWAANKKGSVIAKTNYHRNILATVLADGHVDWRDRMYEDEKIVFLLEENVDPSPIKEKDAICSHCGGFLIHSDGRWQHKPEEEEGERSKVPEEIMQWIKDKAKEFCKLPVPKPEVIISHKEYSLAGLLTWHDGAIAMYHKMQEVIQMYVDVADASLTTIDKVRAEIQTLKEAALFDASLIEQLKAERKKDGGEIQTLKEAILFDVSLIKKGEAANYCATEQYCEKHKRHHFGICPDCPSPVVTTSTTNVIYTVPKEEQQLEGEILKEIEVFIGNAFNKERRPHLDSFEDYRKGAISMYHKMKAERNYTEKISFQCSIKNAELMAEIQTLRKERNEYRQALDDKE